MEEDIYSWRSKKVQCKQVQIFQPNTHTCIHMHLDIYPHTYYATIIVKINNHPVYWGRDKCLAVCICQL